MEREGGSRRRGQRGKLDLSSSAREGLYRESDAGSLEGEGVN
jgi:hypothetical protein